REVEVVATKTARRSDPEEVQIEVIEHAGGVTICAVYPTPRGERPNQCGPGDSGHMSTHNNDVNVEFTVRVPSAVRFMARTVNGGIQARGLAADAEGHTVNGSVVIETRGVARASTVNGSIDAEMGVVEGEPIEFETVNGGITLMMPARSAAELRATTVNGDIVTDFPLTVRGRFNRRRVSGTIGRGGPELNLTTVNGDIRLRSASYGEIVRFSRPPPPAAASRPVALRRAPIGTARRLCYTFPATDPSPEEGPNPHGTHRVPPRHHERRVQVQRRPPPRPRGHAQRPPRGRQAGRWQGPAQSPQGAR